MKKNRPDAVRCKRTERSAGLMKIPVFLLLSFCLTLSSVISAAGQTTNVRGVIQSENGDPIAGATIVVKDSDTWAASDENGRFSIAATPADVLQISFLGYDSQEIAVGSRTNIDIRLISNVIGLEDVVVVGYGSQKKVNLTGAVATVDLRDIEGKPTVNVVEALQGTIPGLTITQSNSMPGSRPGISIRGLNTLNDNSPLIIIDGIQGDIQNINQGDIEQISVLKDAASAAIYGSRASNGVILITTKKGRSGRANVSYEFRLGWQQATELPNTVDSWEYAELRNEALMNSGRAPEFTAEDIAGYRYGGGPNVSWLRELYKNSAPVQTHNISVTGGNDNTTYLLSGGYIDQKSLFKGDNFGLKKYIARMNVSHQFSKRFKVDATASYARNEVRNHAYWTEWIIEQATRTPPIWSMKEGNEYMYPDGAGANPLARLEKGGYNLTSQDDLNGTIKGELTIMRGLRLTGMAGIRITNNRVHENRIAIAEKTSTDLSNAMTESSGRTNDVTSNLLLDYQKVIGKHNFSILGGFSYEASHNNDFRTDRSAAEKDYPYPGYDVLGINASVGSEILRVTNAGWASDWSIYSGLARINYNYDEKYLFEFNIRNDYSSKFAKNNRSGWFPSLSAGWRISEEDFYGNLSKWIPYMKLRGSWGLVGNNRIDNYRYMSTVTVTQGYVLGNQPVNTASYSAANEMLKWEVTRMMNVGLDLSLFTNSFNISFDYYNNMTRDILMELPVPGTYGGGRPIQNAGKVKTQGWELNISYDAKTGDVFHHISANIADTWNEIVDMKGTQTISGNDPGYILKEGYPINAYYAYRWDGFFQNDTELANGPHTSQGAKLGDIRYLDKNGDNEIKPEDDRFILGTRDPRYTFGFTYGLNWKGLDFSIFLQGVGRRYAWLRGENVEAFHNGHTGPVFEFHKDRWTPNNPDATYPRLTVGAESANNVLPSDFWIFNAAYIRVKNIQLGYTLPKKFTRKIHIEDLKLFVSVQNAFTFSPMKGTGYDPEMTESARIFPVTRVFSMGLDLKF